VGVAREDRYVTHYKRAPVGPETSVRLQYQQDTGARNIVTGMEDTEGILEFFWLEQRTRFLRTTGQTRSAGQSRVHCGSESTLIQQRLGTEISWVGLVIPSKKFSERRLLHGTDGEGRKTPDVLFTATVGFEEKWRALRDSNSRLLVRR